MSHMVSLNVWVYVFKFMGAPYVLGVTECFADNPPTNCQ